MLNGKGLGIMGWSGKTIAEAKYLIASEQEWPNWVGSLHISPGLCIAKDVWEGGSADAPGKNIEGDV